MEKKVTYKNSKVHGQFTTIQRGRKERNLFTFDGYSRSSWILKRLVVGVYKCLSLIAGVAVTVAIWRREVVSCRDFILRAVAT